MPTTIDWNDPSPHVATIVFQNRGEDPSTSHYTYNGRDMGTYSDGLQKVVQELESAPEPYVLILHEPGYTVADAGGNVDDLNAKFAKALAGKRVLKYGIDTDAELLVVYISMTGDNRGVYELNGRRAKPNDVLNAVRQQPPKNGLIVVVGQGRYFQAAPEAIRPIALVCYKIDDYMRAYGIVRWLSLQDAVEWKSE